MIVLVLRDKSFTAVIYSFSQYRNTDESSCVESFDQSHIVDVCKELMSYEFVQGAVQARCCCYVRVTRLMRRYLKAPQFVDKVHDKAVASESTAQMGDVDIKHLDSFSLLQGKSHVLLSFQTTAFHTKFYTNEKRAVALLSSHVICFYAAALPNKLKTVHRSALSANGSTSKKL